MDNKLVNRLQKSIKKVRHHLLQLIQYSLCLFLADNQKQERIETMINDLNKYKKIEKDLNILQDKHIQLEKDLNSKLNDLTHQRDELKKSYDQLNEQIQYYEQLQNKYEQLQEELNTKNDLLKQSKLENNGSIT